jgi:hypothetical protein
MIIIGLMGLVPGLTDRKVVCVSHQFISSVKPSDTASGIQTKTSRMSQMTVLIIEPRGTQP